MFDTIAAISTPRGEGGIGIVRISGKRKLLIYYVKYLNQNLAEMYLNLKVTQ